MALWFFLFIDTYANSGLGIELYTNEIKARNKKLPEPVTPKSGLTLFHYSPKSTLNPFEPNILRKRNKNAYQSSNDQNRLANNGVDSLKFSGLIIGGSKKWALITLREGRLSYAKIGDYLENQGGRVIEIYDEYIEVEEKFFTAGRWLRRIKKFYLITERRG